MSTTQVLKRIYDLQKKQEALYPKAIEALFKEQKDLQSFKLEAKEEYDDNNYYTEVSIEEINEVPLPYPVSSDYFAEEIDEDPQWKTFFMAAKVKVDEVLKLLEIIQSIDSSYVQNNLCYDPVKRNDYVKKPTAKKTAKA